MANEDTPTNTDQNSTKENDNPSSSKPIGDPARQNEQKSAPGQAEKPAPVSK